MPHKGMTDDEKDRLRSNHATLVEELAKPGIKKLLDMCLQVGLVNDDQYDDLLELQATKDDKARQFLSMMKKSRKEHTFDLLCKALKEAGFAYAVSLLSPSSTTTESCQTLSRDNSHVSLYVWRLLTPSDLFHSSVVCFNFQPVMIE